MNLSRDQQLMANSIMADAGNDWFANQMRTGAASSMASTSAGIGSLTQGYGMEDAQGTAAAMTLASATNTPQSGGGIAGASKIADFAAGAGVNAQEYLTTEARYDLDRQIYDNRQILQKNEQRNNLLGMGGGMMANGLDSWWNSESGSFAEGFWGGA
ncbi:hypothetical protein ACPV5S_15695 [Vibrio astriarenae]